MAKLIFCLVTENIITDTSTNLISAINIVERLQGAVIPGIKPLLYLLLQWNKETSFDQPERFTFKIRIKYPTLGYLDSPVGIIDAEIPADKSNLRFVSRIEGMPLREVGVTEFEIKQKINEGWKKVGSFPVEVRITP